MEHKPAPLSSFSQQDVDRWVMCLSKHNCTACSQETRESCARIRSNFTQTQIPGILEER